MTRQDKIKYIMQQLNKNVVLKFTLDIRSRISQIKKRDYPLFIFIL